MNKLRINPRGNNNTQQNENLKSGNDTSKVSLENVSETIDFFLNKNEKEFTKDDIQTFQNLNQQNTDKYLEISRRVINKLFAISKVLVDKNNEVIKNVKQEDSFEIVSRLPKSFVELNSLIAEIVEDNYEEGLLFLTTLINELVIVDVELQKEQISIENLYNLLSEMLRKLQAYSITQQKYIYRSIANSINLKTPNYSFISPEDGNFVDPKFHKNVSGNGQRILRGLTYILLSTENDEVLKFGNVKTI
ncbi:hypothetical protein MPF19_16585 [Polaribacter sp. Z014]|uniref:hypothetical protein n=1 Tax=unclassified Polaribacter TaxID=196858 RepID=UPI0020205AD0|nr:MULTISPECIES: hypothetical protein [unclassified Polaribacter]MCL7765042.1 hypothetical protein [Polaribacter sp. Z014]MDX6746983.1 hypothetical protein [Polaribacter sp. PL03]